MCGKKEKVLLSHSVLGITALGIGVIVVNVAFDLIESVRSAV